MGVRLTNRPLAANEEYTQGWIDRLQEKAVVAVHGLAYADQAGTLYLEESDDEGENVTGTLNAAVAAKTTTELAWTNLTKRWYRFRYANDAAAQALFVLIQQVADDESLVVVIQ